MRDDTPPSLVVAALTASGDGRPAGDGWLTDAERARLAAISAPARRAQYLAGHWFARELAGAVLEVAPARLGFGHDGQGRPRLVLGREPVGFVSLSHSGDWLACAFSARPVGVDIEFPRRVRDLDGLARFTFSPDEAAGLATLAGTEREAAFYRLWTLKEARGKRSGEGLMPARARSYRAIESDAPGAEAATWRVDAGALAIVGDGVETITPAGLPGPAGAMFWRFLDPP